MLKTWTPQENQEKHWKTVRIHWQTKGQARGQTLDALQHCMGKRKDNTCFAPSSFFFGGDEIFATGWIYIVVWAGEMLPLEQNLGLEFLIFL